MDKDSHRKIKCLYHHLHFNNRTRNLHYLRGLYGFDDDDIFCKFLINSLCSSIFLCI